MTRVLMIAHAHSQDVYSCRREMGRSQEDALTMDERSMCWMRLARNYSSGLKFPMYFIILCYLHHSCHIFPDPYICNRSDHKPSRAADGLGSELLCPKSLRQGKRRLCWWALGVQRKVQERIKRGKELVSLRRRRACIPRSMLSRECHCFHVDRHFTTRSLPLFSLSYSKYPQFCRCIDQRLSSMACHQDRHSMTQCTPRSAIMIFMP